MQTGVNPIIVIMPLEKLISPQLLPAGALLQFRSLLIVLQLSLSK